MACEQEIEAAIAAEGQVLLGWRDVPVNNDGLGEGVKAIEPVIRQISSVADPRTWIRMRWNAKLYIIRKSSGHAIQALKLPTEGSSTCRRCRRARLFIRACCWPIRWAPLS